MPHNGRVRLLGRHMQGLEALQDKLSEVFRDTIETTQLGHYCKRNPNSLLFLSRTYGHPTSDTTILEKLLPAVAGVRSA